MATSPARSPLHIIVGSGFIRLASSVSMAAAAPAALPRAVFTMASSTDSANGLPLMQPAFKPNHPIASTKVPATTMET